MNLTSYRFYSPHRVQQTAHRTPRATNRTPHTKNVQHITRSAVLAIKSLREISQSVLFKQGQDCKLEYSDVMCRNYVWVV